MFWEDDGSGAPDKIDIELGGTTYIVSIEIKVDGRSVHSSGLARSGTRYSWNDMRIEFDHASMYQYSGATLYARKTSNASWVKLIEFDTDRKATLHPDVKTVRNNIEFLMSRDLYAEYGFEFDIVAGMSWPYSDVFWTEADSQREKVDTIYIGTGGAVRTPDISIKVNRRTVDGGTSMSSGVQRDWSKLGNEIRVGLYKTGAYLNNSRAFYARKAGGDWECLFDTLRGDHDIYISPDYVEFGFEFDVYWGMQWPYSDVFWTEADSAREKVRSIQIYTGGIAFNPSIEIKVNRNKKVYESECEYHIRPHLWKHREAVEVNISDDGAYHTKARNFYARKAGGNWEKVYSKGDSNRHQSRRNSEERDHRDLGERQAYILRQRLLQPLTIQLVKRLNIFPLLAGGGFFLPVSISAIDE